MQDFLAHFEAKLGRMQWRLSSLVESETPTDQKEHVDEFGEVLARWAEEQGAYVTIHPQFSVGDFVECRWNVDTPGKPILILCHMDTVHPLGSVEKRPTEIIDDVLYGVGAYDMKASIAVIETVIEELILLNQMPFRPITLLLTSDEEIGSVYSRPLIEKLAHESGLVLVMEFSDYEERIVTSRRGVGIFQITTVGREAHSGSAPELGINAIVEAAHLIDDVLELNDVELGTTVVPAKIDGGTRHNVIPGACDVLINVRVGLRRESIRVYQGLSEIAENRVYLPGAERFLTGEYMRPPMERDDTVCQAFETLKEISGQQFGESSRGGGSDGSFSAALGIPTLDGLGPSGEGAHSANEQVYLPSMPRRAALIAAILRKWPHMPED